MSISKISRGLVVVIFTVLIIFLLVLNIQLLFKNVITNNISSKLVYVAALLMLVTIYALVKEKLWKKGIKKGISLTYRYVFLITLTYVVKVISIYSVLQDATKYTVIIFAVISVLSAILLKKIIYNISKSDLLSVIGMLMFAFIPDIVSDKLVYINMSGITLFTLLSIFVIQKLIDELKQPGIKTKKYLKLSLIIGVTTSITLILNINSLIWILLVLSFIVITSNLDRTHINFYNKIMSNISQKNREMLYRIERIYVNKIFISIIVILLSSYVSYIILNFIIFNINIPVFTNVITSIKDYTGNNVLQNIMSFNIIEKHTVISNVNTLLNNSKLFYLIIMIYILFIEILTVSLRRRYDTKSTIIKTLFILLITFYSLFGYNVYVYSEVLTVLLILISIINTSNIYLNRDERVKLLNP